MFHPYDHRRRPCIRGRGNCCVVQDTRGAGGPQADYKKEPGDLMNTDIDVDMPVTSLRAHDPLNRINISPSIYQVDSRCYL